MLGLARWSTAHRRLVVGIWTLVLAAGVSVLLGVGNRYSNDLHLPRTGSQQARDLLAVGFPAQAGDQDQIVFRARAGTLIAPAARRRVERVLAQVRRLRGVDFVTGPYAAQGHALSRDRTIGFATVVLRRTGSHASNRTTKQVIATAKSGRSPTLQVELGGPAIENAQQTAIGSSMVIGLCAAVVVLLLSFGSLLAMGLPIFTALFGLGTGLGSSRSRAAL